MKVLFVTNLPSPYRVDIFNELGCFCDLTVCYERHNASDRDASWENKSQRKYTEIFCDLPPLGTDRSMGSDVIKKIRSVKHDKLILSGYASPSIMLAIAYCRLTGREYIIESDGGFDKKDRFPLRILKKFLLLGAKAHFTTCDSHVRYLENLGIKKDKIYKYPFSSLWQKDILPMLPTKAEKDKIKTELDIPYDKVVLSVGRFIHKKGYDVLLSAARNIDNNTGIYIIGGKAASSYTEYVEQHKLSNVYFVDFMSKENLKKWYALADVFVLPTRSDIWGLVINEAMAAGLPVVTTDMCMAGLEMVTDDINGYIVPIENSTILAEKINAILNYDGIRKEMSENSLKKIKEYTIENIAKRHIEILETL